MFSLLGVPLFGSVFLPLIVGIVTVFFFWVFVFSKKSLQTPAASDEFKKPNILSERENSVHITGNQIKEQNKNKCGGDEGCCSKKNGKAGCSEKNAIETVQVFTDNHSNICQESAIFLWKQLTDISLSVNIVEVSDLEKIDLVEHSNGPLCIFLMDSSIYSNGHMHWLQEGINNMIDCERPLSGMKYTVFMFQSSPLDKSKVDVIDQLLHRCGGVRVCRAGGAELSSSVSSSHFENWAAELFTRVQRWNDPKKRACKCGPKNKTEQDQNDDSCSNSSGNSGKCSDSEDNGVSQAAAKRIVDLEDIGKLL